ncbi:MAG: glycosyl hydrolase family 95 catalytic domain-containing protein, partial [Planctomycetota bacterium]
MQNNRNVHLACWVVFTVICSQVFAESSILTVDYRNLVSRADLTYEKPVVRAEEGLPVGNGTMGSLVWTSPTALKFQLNRVDVYAMNSYTRSFNRRDWDYSYGCGHVNIDFVDFGKDVFGADKCVQHLSVYDALATVTGKDVTSRVLAWHRKDVMAVEVTDNRSEPQVINTNLRMMRHKAKSFPGQSAEYIARQNSVVMTKHHKATSKFHFRNGRIILTQKFEEGDYYCGSAVALGIIGRESKAKLANVAEARLAAKAGNGKFTILMASAASFDPEEDLVATALEKLDAAMAKGFEGLLEDNKNWWHDFWSKAFIHLNSSDGSAELVEQHYTYFLYIMGSSSRGKYPPRYGAMIWSTEGDYRHWGSQHWWFNLRAYYRGLPATNRLELMDPMFSMYSGMYESSAIAARQQWDSKGIFIPETTSFNGLEVLPEDIAAEMRDLYLLRKPWDQRSQKFRDFAFSKHPHNGRW